MRRVVIKGGHVVSMDAAIGEVAGADVLVEDDRIVAVARGIEVDAEIIDASQKIVLPGFINGHPPHMADRLAWPGRRLDRRAVHASDASRPRHTLSAR